MHYVVAVQVSDVQSMNDIAQWFNTTVTCVEKKPYVDNFGPVFKNAATCHAQTQ